MGILIVLLIYYMGWQCPLYNYRQDAGIYYLLGSYIGYHYYDYCFLQVLFGQSCKIFLDIVACPNWTKLQSLGWLHINQPKAIADII